MQVTGICTLNTVNFTGSNLWWTMYIVEPTRALAAAGLIILKALVTCSRWWKAFTQNVTPCILHISYIQYWSTVHQLFYILIGLGMYSYSNYLRSYNCVILKPKLKSVLYKHQYSNVTRSSLLWWCSLSYFYSDISGQGTVGGNHPTSFNLWGQHWYTNRFC